MRELRRVSWEGLGWGFPPLSQQAGKVKSLQECLSLVFDVGF